MNRNRLMVANMLVTCGFAAVNFILGLVEVRLFLSNYGSVVNGLIQTGNQALSYISLIESGICAAFLYYLYKPIGAGDYRQVSCLHKGFQQSMQRVVTLMMIAALAICAIMPVAIQDKTLGYGLSFAILALTAARFILPYAISLAPKYMLIAKEQKYKAEIIDGLKLTGVYLADVLILLFWKPPILLLLLVNALIVLGVSLLCRAMMRRAYRGCLSEDVQADKTPAKMSRDLLAHNVSGLAFNSSANIVLSIFTPSLTSATVYSSYNRIISNIVSTGQKIVEGANASMGIKISRNDANVYSVFREIVSSTQFLFSVISIVAIACINTFIRLWIGEQYILPAACAYLFGLSIYAETMLRAYFTARNARGLFKESRNFTILQAVVHIAFSVALVGKLGVLGILIGITVGRYLIALPCNYRLVYRQVFSSEKPRWWELAAAPGVIVALALLSQGICACFGALSDIALLLCQFAVSLTVSVLGCFVYQRATDQWFGPMLKRCMALLHRQSGRQN